MAQRSEAIESCAYGSCIHSRSGTLIDTSRLFFRLARCNLCARQEKFYDKTDSKGHIFQKPHTKKPLVSDNAPELCDEDLNLWLEKIGCKPYKTPAYHPQSNGLAERLEQTTKMEPKACSQQKEKIEVFRPRLLLSYRTKPYDGGLESPSALMGRQSRAPLTMSYSTNEKVWYKKN